MACWKPGWRSRKRACFSSCRLW